MELAEKKENKYMWVIGLLSVLIPVAVGVLMFSSWKVEGQADWISFLPHLNGMINTATSVVLILGLFAIKNKNIEWHRNLMLIAFTLGSIFLVSYVIYHASAPSTLFGDVDKDGMVSLTEKGEVGTIRYVYLALLLSHILTAAVVVPFVLLAVYYAIIKRFDKHLKIVKWAFPIWLYVSITGVLVYLMISPYY
jgi:putative membrane protein